MKIVQVSASVAPRDGGPTTSALGLSKALNELGVEDLLITTDADGALGRLGCPDRHALLSYGSSLIVCARSWPWRLKNSWRLARCVWHESRNADLIHIHGVYLAHTAWSYLAARWFRVPYTVQPHGTLEPYQRQFGQVHKAVWDRVVGRRILTGAAALIVASDSERTNLKSLVPRAKIIVTPLGVTTTEPHLGVDRRAEFSQWLSAPKERRILFLGRLARKKRPDILVSGWAKTEDGDSQLAIVGPEEDWTHDQIRALAPSERRQNLTVSDSLGTQGVAWLMSQASIFVLPSENENFGIAVAEAMAYGCTVITTAQTAAGEHVTIADCGIVLKSASADLVREALNSLVGDRQALEEFGSKAQVYAASELTWHKTALRLISDPSINLQASDRAD